MSTSTQATIRYMFVMTVSLRNGQAQATTTGTVDVKPGTSRLAVFTYVVDTFIKGQLGAQEFSVLYYSLELDAL